MERLTERFENGQVGVVACGKNCKHDHKFCENAREDCPTFDDIYEKLATYEDAEEQGRLVKLPCNRGDKIYFIKSAFSMAHFPIEAKVTSIYGVDCDNDVMYSSITEYNKIDRRFRSSDIGKTVFLTKSEAEAKLKEMRGGEDER